MHLKEDPHTKMLFSPVFTNFLIRVRHFQFKQSMTQFPSNFRFWAFLKHIIGISPINDKKDKEGAHQKLLTLRPTQM